MCECVDTLTCVNSSTRRAEASCELVGSRGSWPILEIRVWKRNPWVLSSIDSPFPKCFDVFHHDGFQSLVSDPYPVIVILAKCPRESCLVAGKPWVWSQTGRTRPRPKSSSIMGSVPKRASCLRISEGYLAHRSCPRGLWAGLRMCPNIRRAIIRLRCILIRLRGVKGFMLVSLNINTMLILDTKPGWLPGNSHRSTNW